MPHGVIPIVGTGKKFKSGTLYSILESCPDLRKRRKAFVKFPNVSIFPRHLNAYAVNSMDEVQPDDVVVIEDANRIYPSRAKNPDLQSSIGTISHDSNLVFITVQNTQDTDIALFRSQEMVYVHKQMDPYAIPNEREDIQENCGYANWVIPRSASVLGVDPLYVSFIPHNDECMFIEPPKWYGFAHSHALRKGGFAVG